MHFELHGVCILQTCTQHFGVFEVPRPEAQGCEAVVYVIQYLPQLECPPNDGAP